jgi:hypothetical protein
MASRTDAPVGTPCSADRRMGDQLRPCWRGQRNAGDVERDGGHMRVATSQNGSPDSGVLESLCARAGRAVTHARRHARHP